MKNLKGNMNRRKIALNGIAIALGATSYLAADSATNVQSVKSPQQIETEIQQAQYDFEIAQKMFIPYYTGPLITGSASNVPSGHINIQPYLFLTVNHAQYNGHRKSINTPNTYIINPVFTFQAGLTSWMDVTLLPQAAFKWQKGHNADKFGDLPLQFGFQLYKETPYIPNFRFILGQSFPTGSYRSLNPHKLGLDATGSGVFSGLVGLNISKVFWWWKLHPVAVRLANMYAFSENKASVRGYNAYGGGHGTHGKVSVGNSFSTDLGIEVSLTQKWVFATDVAYTCQAKSTFRGNPGDASEGIVPTNGAPSSDQLSLSPSIEYNVSDSAGFIGGVWFSVTGRNSANFASLVLSYTVLF